MTDLSSPDSERRNFIFIATGAFAFGGAVMAAWPLVDQMNPAGDTRASSSLDVDISKLEAGSEIRALIGGLPWFIRRGDCCCALCER